MLPISQTDRITLLPKTNQHQFPIYPSCCQVTHYKNFAQKKGWEMRGGEMFLFFLSILSYWPRLKILANLLWGITITLQCEKTLEKWVADMLTINLGQTPFKLNQNILQALNSFIPSLKLLLNFQCHLKPSETHLLRQEALERWMVSRWEEGWDGYWPAGKKTRQIEAFSRTTTLD